MRHLWLFLFLGWSGALFAQPKNLDQFIEQARTKSPILKGYQAQLLQLRLDSALLRASFGPQVNFISGNLYAPIINNYGYDEAITNLAQVSGLVQVSRNFIRSGEQAARFRSFFLQNLALRDTIQISTRDLIRTITDQYITAYSDLIVLNYSKELFDLLKKEEVALKTLAQASVIKQTEFLAFDITLQQQELTYLQAQIQYNTDYLTLNYLSGINDTTIALLEQPDLKLAVFGDLNTSVFVTRFRTDSLRIENEKKILGYLYKPQIGAFTDAGYNSTLTHLPYRNFGFSFGLSLRIPIYDGHQKNLRYQQLSIQEDLRRSNQEFYTAQYGQQINVLRSQLQATENLFSKIDTQVRYTKTLITAYSKLFQTGDIRITELITAITSYLNAQNVLRQNIITGLRLRSQINYYNP